MISARVAGICWFRTLSVRGLEISDDALRHGLVETLLLALQHRAAPAAVLGQSKALVCRDRAE